MPCVPAKTSPSCIAVLASELLIARGSLCRNSSNLERTVSFVTWLVPNLSENSGECSAKSVPFSNCRYPTGVSVAGVETVGDRKSTRLNSSHGYISYAVFCLKKKKKIHKMTSHYIDTVTLHQ